jgi:hypothetical protein
LLVPERQVSRDARQGRWFNADWTGVSANVTAFATEVGRVGGSTQYAYRGNDCEGQKISLGREYGPRTNAYEHREKVHVRIFETGEGQSAGDAHREGKVTCGGDGKRNDDAVYRRLNGKGGFDAAMDQMVRAFRRSSGWAITFDTVPSPYVRAFKQCNGHIVRWSGDVAYMTRMSGTG